MLATLAAVMLSAEPAVISGDGFTVRAPKGYSEVKSDKLPPGAVGLTSNEDRTVSIVTAPRKRLDEFTTDATCKAVAERTARAGKLEVIEAKGLDHKVGRACWLHFGGAPQVRVQIFLTLSADKALLISCMGKLGQEAATGADCKTVLESVELPPAK